MAHQMLQVGIWRTHMLIMIHTYMIHAYMIHTGSDMAHHILPLNSYLKAKSSSCPAHTGNTPAANRTWSSALFDTVHTHDAALAHAVKKWTLHAIHTRAADPKGADDPEGGGEWFTGWLRAVHRDIYDDIDHSDCGELLTLKWAKSLGVSKGQTQKKYNLGEISVPSCEEGFKEIAAVSLNERVTPRAEIQAKILIDIWMAQLVDFVTLLKILQLILLNFHLAFE